jgi:hypothetical protein
MESEEEHQVALKEDAIMKPVKGRKKWQRGGSQLQGDVESQRN